jgi:hypothetical protein
MLWAFVLPSCRAGRRRRISPAAMALYIGVSSSIDMLLSALIVNLAFGRRGSGEATTVFFGCFCVFAVLSAALSDRILQRIAAWRR